MSGIDRLVPQIRCYGDKQKASYYSCMLWKTRMEMDDQLYAKTQSAVGTQRRHRYTNRAKAKANNDDASVASVELS